MKSPTLEDVRAALEHGLWLRHQECTGEGRMLADLAWAYSHLRTTLEALEKVATDALTKQNLAEADRDMALRQLDEKAPR